MGPGKKTAVNRLMGPSSSLRDIGYHVCNSKSNPRTPMLVGVGLLIDHHDEGLELIQGLAGAVCAD